MDEQSSSKIKMVSLPAMIETRNAQHFRDHTKKPAGCAIQLGLGKSDWNFSGCGTLLAFEPQ
jgi:hypothetical protein